MIIILWQTSIYVLCFKYICWNADIFSTIFIDYNPK